MRRAFVLMVIVCGLCSWAVAKAETPARCPTIRITGPAGIVGLNKIAQFTVDLDLPESQKEKLEYVWTVNTGRIATGQGTRSIGVRRTDGIAFTATVEIKGLPTECPNMASEHLLEDVGPEAVKIGEFDGKSFKGDRIELNSIIHAMADNPTNQLYVFFAYEAAPISEAARRPQQQVLDYLSDTIGGRDRITSVEYFKGVELIQFWRVPPGAENPLCVECDAKSCPEISVTGPAGVTQPGDIAVFTANVTRSFDSFERKYNWTISAGTIIKGQGTHAIEVATDKASPETLSVTVEVDGLNGSCANSASLTAQVNRGGHADILDEITTRSQSRIRAQLNAAAEHLHKHPGQQLIFIIWAGENEPQSSLDRRESFIRAHLTTKLRLKPSRFHIIRGGVRSPITRIYVAPEGSFPNDPPK